ncbi:hypothetical protein NN3_41740 [Nocardia neocaledoniensis NBRC 108232]|uniref:Uncharacterized protein n=1 Tax=Nocardia neocaledoniensis TaxID=236511 RepID=A0A317NGK0_9NOCA|nr:hypothetical protein DFR69_106337 [Nocardia neocaledoniensis]GEM33167.1 hypothetical protein NN3_41740 [Nocardia neocaledoniensis NBRC 108232]
MKSNRCIHCAKELSSDTDRQRGIHRHCAQLKGTLVTPMTTMDWHAVARWLDPGHPAAVGQMGAE